MESDRFDGLARSVSIGLSRRTLTGVLGLSALGLPSLTNAKKKKRKKKKVKFNDFDCVNVGSFCKNDEQCCSGICEGKKDKKKCRAHNTSTCQPGQDICVVGPAICLTETGDTGLCGRTTGGAGYCEVGGECFACQKDVDCEPLCGPGAACLDCPGCADEQGIKTACAGQSLDSCSFPP